MAPRVSLVVVALLLASCGRNDTAADTRAQRDPAVTGALSDPLMADPDLTTQNQGGAALTGGGPASAEIPPDKRTDEEKEASRSAARALLGGTIAAAPPVEGTTGESRLKGAVTAPMIANALGLGGKGCADRLQYSAIWAARLSPPFEVYPRGHVGQVAGSDDGGCKLRVVGFVTPVASGEVVDFYAARLKAAGLALRHVREGEDEVIEGRKGAAGFAISVSTRADGMTEAQLVTSGF